MFLASIYSGGIHISENRSFLFSFCFHGFSQMKLRRHTWKLLSTTAAPDCRTFLDFSDLLEGTSTTAKESKSIFLCLRSPPAPHLLLQSSRSLLFACSGFYSQIFLFELILFNISGLVQLIHPNIYDWSSSALNNHPVL